jgi:hypothetical protein
MRRLNLLMHLFLALPLGACSDGGRAEPAPTSLPGSTLQDISSAESAWVQSGMRSYDMVVLRECFCHIQPYDDASVSVVSGQVDSALGSDDDLRHSVQLASDQHMPWFTVPGQFQMMRDALADGQVVIANLDSSTGRPSTFTLRPQSDAPLTDADITFEITHFLPH